MMLRLAVELCNIQNAAGRLVVFDNPRTAASWEDESLRELMSLKKVIVTTLDMCRYGMEATDKEGTAPVRKTMRIATNSAELADALSARCEGGHRHVHLVPGRPKLGAVSEGFL